MNNELTLNGINCNNVTFIENGEDIVIKVNSDNNFITSVISKDQLDIALNFFKTKDDRSES